MFLPLPERRDAAESLMAARDWMATPLGDPAQWEPALQYALRRMFDADRAAFIVWGEQKLFFCNDACLALLDSSDPGRFGIPIAQAWPEAAAALSLDGCAAHFSLDCTPLRTLDGAQRGRYCSVALTPVTEQPWRAARERLGAALDAAGVATWDWDVRADVLHADAALRELYGVPASAEAGASEALAPYLAAIHLDDVAGVRARIGRALAGGEAFSDSYRVRRASGGWRHVEARGKVALGADGLPAWMSGVVLDVSERKEAEARLRRSEARFLRLAESNVLGIVQYREDGALLEPNDAFLAILGVARADYERDGLSWRALTPPEWVDADERGWAQLHASGVMEPYEKEYLRADGSRAAVFLGAANVEGDPHVGIGYVLDISGIRAAEQALKESEARFRVIANAMPQAVWSTRPDGFHDYYNDQWYAFTGVPYGTTDGDGWNDLFHPDEQELAWDKWRESLRTGATYEIEYRLRHHSGGYRWVLGRALPVRAEDGTIVRWMGTCTDIHEQKLAQQALQQADRRKDEFLAMLAHELRNPLAPIVTAASLLSLATGVPERVQQIGKVISRQATHMTGLIDDLMDVSRVTRGMVTLDKDTVALASVIEDSVEQVRPLLEGRGHRLDLRAALDDALVAGDRKRLVQVLANILGNAAKYTPAHGHIVLDAGIEDGRAMIAVRDNGAGMAPELVASAFELFHQGKRSPDRSQGGLGVGLALVRSLVQLHGGAVHAASEGEGQGSTFTVTLPLLALPARLDTGAVAAVSPALRALRVLVVDDNQDAAELAAMLLELLGYQVSVEFDPAAALERARLWQPQVCLLDIGLPGMDGKELARRLRQIPGLATVRLAAMTGYGQPHDRAASAAAGFDAHFVKPVDAGALAAWRAETPEA